MSSCVGHRHTVVHRANRISRRAAQPLGARFVDLTGLVCLRYRCPLIVDDVVTFRDASHLSVTWVKKAAPDLGRLLKL